MNATLPSSPRRNKRTLPFAVPFGIDLASVGLFALLARIAHRSAEEPVTFLTWANTAWPFALGTGIAWALAWSGVLSTATGLDRRFGVAVWLHTVALGLLIWGLRHGAIPHWSFMIVASTVSGALLLGWRLLSRRFVR